MQCNQCGGNINPSTQFCERCGEKVDGEGADSTPSVFAKIKASPEFARRNDPERHASLPHILVGDTSPFRFTNLIVMIKALVIIFCLAVWISEMFLWLFGLFGMWIVYVIFNYTRFTIVPVRGEAAILRTKRLDRFPGDEGDLSGEVSGYLFTFEYEDGHQKQFRELQKKSLSDLAEGDAGVVYTRSKYVLGMDRVVRGSPQT